MRKADTKTAGTCLRLVRTWQRLGMRPSGWPRTSARVGTAFVFCVAAHAVAFGADPQRGPRFDGYYVGGGLGVSAGSGDWQTTGPGGPTASGTYSFAQPFDAFAGTGSYGIYLQAGRDWRLPSGVVLGIVGDAQAMSLVEGSVTHTTPAGAQARVAEDVAVLGTVRGRAGVIQNGWLWYGTAGWAWTWNHYTRDQITGAAAGGTATAGSSELVNTFRSGYVVGAGVEMPVTARWHANLEYLFTSFGRTSAALPEGAQRISSDLDLHTLRVGLSYRFAAEELGTPAARPSPPKSDTWSVHAQTTYVHQFVPSFTSPYRGTNSLVPGQARQTWDATFYIGFRPWKDAEVWLNPEIDQGFGLSGTLGLAGFSSGEAYKLGSEHPYARLHRGFIRQTFNISGEGEKVEAGPNQMAGIVRENRVVLTVGKFGAVDIFDANKYAHDPRVDFLNWSILDTGSFDYAADAWGYTYGIAAEWYVKNWTFRAGLFDLPTVPNSTRLDPSFGQFQWMGEIERRHQLWGNPGKIAVSGFLTRARMGRFSDAIALANAAGGAADISAVREFRSRGGIAMNVEQQLAPSVGAFLRAGWSDGTAEPFAFTDIDKTVAGGFVFDGKLWGRTDHTIGLAGALNAISKVHERFLDAGGLGILVGDGRLPRPAGERILETYYAFPLAPNLRVTFDYQYVVNPAYNTERGPVSILGTRLRSQF